LIINDLKERGIKEVLLFIADGPSGIRKNKEILPNGRFSILHNTC